MIFPNLRHLEIFLALCKSGSVSDTANRMHLTQPAVSKAIAQLEETTQLTLFDRRRNRLFLNDAGVRLRDEADRLLNQVRRFSEEVDAQQSTMRGQITVAAIPSMAFGPLSRAVTRFQEDNPQVRFALQLEMSRRVVEMVTQKRADIGFIHGASNAAHVAETYLGDSEVMCLMHQDHPLTGLAEITPADLDGVPLIQFDAESPPSVLIRESFAKFGIRPRTKMELNVSKLSDAMLAPGDVALVDPFAISPRKALVTRPFVPRIPLSIFMLTPDDASQSRIRQAFIDETRSRIARMRRALRLQKPS